MNGCPFLNSRAATILLFVSRIFFDRSVQEFEEEPSFIRRDFLIMVVTSALTR